MARINHQPDSFIFAPDLPNGDDPAHAYYSNLLKGLTHKLNNHASVVQGFGSLLLMEDHLNEEMRGNIEQIRQSGQEISALMKRVLALTTSTNNAPQTIQPNNYLQSVQNELREMSTSAETSFDIQMDADLPAIKCDPSLLHKLLIELFKNACESASTIGGQITLSISGPGVRTPADDNRVDILLTNTGMEFPRDQIEEAFTPFFTTKSGEHIGLGLTVAAALAKRIGARLGMTTEGETTQAWLSIPVASAS